jgi:putative membrane protein
MKTKTFTLACTLFAAAVSFSAAQAQSQPAGSGSMNGSRDSSMLKGSDKAFFEKAAKSGEKEVAVSQAVLPHLTNPQVRSFAQQMISDHTMANTELKSLAMSKGVTLPTMDQKLSAKWSEKKGDTDEDYVEEMISDHKEAVELFEKASKSQDAEIAAFASSTLPKLQHHLESAKELDKMLD